VAGSARAQTLTGSIAGTVKDEQGAELAGAKVTLSGKTGSTEATTDARGLYRFPSVEPGAYSLAVSMDGFQGMRQEGLSINIGRHLSVDPVLKLSGRAEAVEVVADAPMVDVSSSATSDGLSQDLLFNLPLGRFTSDLLDYLPGINNSQAYGGGTSANGFYLDGVSTRSSGGGSNYVYLNFNVVEDFQVQGIGAQAEYGSFTGAVINYVTRSGGNQYSALFDVQYSDDGLASSNVTPKIAAANPSLADPQVTTKLLDMTAQLSGPIIKDKLFFFVSGQRYKLDYDPPGPRTVLGEVTPRLNVKLTFEPSPKDVLTGLFQAEDYNRTGRSNFYAGSAATTDALSLREDAPDRLWSLQWRHLFGAHTFIEAKYHGYTAKTYKDPAVNAPIHYSYETGGYSGGGGYFTYADRKKQTVTASVSHYAEAFGHHDMKFGVEIERSRARDRFGYTGGLYFYDYNGPYQAYSYSYDITGDNHRESFFAQDAWKASDRLTVNGGLRLDRLRGLNPGVSQPLYSTTNLAPRIGFAFDLTGDHKTVLRGFYGQYYEDLLEYQYSRLLPGTEDRITYDVTGATPVEIDRTPLSNLAYRMDPHIKHPRVDELSLGFERALSGDLRLSVTGVLRSNKNFIGSVIPSARWTPTQVTNGLTGQPLTVYTWANPDESESDLFITNPDGFVFRDPAGNPLGTTEASARYRALIVSLEKRLSNRWQAKVSYVLSKSEGTVDPYSNEHVGYGRQFETPTLALVNVDGPFYGSRPHELKVLFTYQVPKVEVNVNAYYRLISGETYTPYQRYSSSEINFVTAGREPWLEPHGSQRLSVDSRLDLRLEKTFKIPAGRIGLYADIFNVFNTSYVDAVQQRVPSTSVEGFDVLYGAPTSIEFPRQLTVGARWSF
jgi:outer membrane receptor protein involved in Fe transport